MLEGYEWPKVYRRWEPAEKMFRENDLIEEKFRKLTEDPKFVSFREKLLAYVKEVANESKISVTPEMEGKISCKLEGTLKIVLYYTAADEFIDQYEPTWTLEDALYSFLDVPRFKAILKWYTTKTGAMDLLIACR